MTIEYKHGVLPRSVANALSSKKLHELICFGDEYYFVGLQNTMYRCDGVTFYSDKPTPIHKLPSYYFVEKYNPETMGYERIDLESSSFYDRNKKSQIDNYISGVEDYCYADYDDYQGWLGFDVKSYLKEKYSNEISLVEDDCGDILVEAHGERKRFQCFRNFTNNEVFGWYDNKLPYQMLFESANELYSFKNELDERMKTFHVGDKWSSLYDKIVSGEIDKSQFIKEMVK